MLVLRSSSKIHKTEFARQYLWNGCSGSRLKWLYLCYFSPPTTHLLNPPEARLSNATWKSANTKPGSQVTVAGGVSKREGE